MDVCIKHYEKKKKTKMILIQKIHAVKLVCTHRVLDKVQLKKVIIIQDYPNLDGI